MARIMAEASLSRRLSAPRSVDNQDKLVGELEPQSFKRVAGAVLEVISKVQYSLEFFKDSDGVMAIEGHCQTQVVMTCERCLGEVKLDVEGEFQLGLVYSDDQAKHLPKHYEPALMDEHGNINPWEIIEDELLLALPMYANHPDDECVIKQPDSPELNEESAEEVDRPFDVLKQLKKPS